ncbi:hypothetical protein R83H12_02744 [Fibrobacteria bacterium R8-3-H12]
MENTATNGYAVYNNSTGGILLSGDPTITGTIMKAGTGILSVDGSFEPAEGKTYTLGFTNFDGAVVAGGADKTAFFIVNSTFNGIALSLIGQGNDLIFTTTGGYAVENSEETYTITKGTGPYILIQQAINDIRTQANGAAVSIQFGDGTSVLDIGNENITFSGSDLSPASGVLREQKTIRHFKLQKR